MKKLYLLFILLLSGVDLQAQDFYISFQPEVSGISMDSILVTNLRTNQKIKLLKSDSLLLTKTSTAILSIQSNFEPGTIYPNPSAGDAALIFSSGQKEQVEVSIYNVSGQLLSLKKQNVAPGLHRFRLKFPMAGIYYISVLKSTGPSGFKAICTGEVSQECNIYYNGTENVDYSQTVVPLKSSTTVKTMIYAPEDILYCSAFSGRYNTIITDSPTATKVYNVEFFACIDPDNNSYPIVEIGNQWWMAKNLARLPEVSPSSVGSETSSYFYVYGYEGTSVPAAKATPYFSTYGALYNWPAVMDGAASSNTNPSNVRGVCPAGWHLPSDAEWTILSSLLGGESITGGLMKETGTAFWVSPNSGATNRSGFTGLPGGARANSGAFQGAGLYGYLWSSTGISPSDAWYRGLFNDNPYLGHSSGNKQNGFSVRCVKDNTSPATVITNPVTGITQTTATFGGNVTSDGNAAVTERGFVYSQTQNPTTANNKVPVGNGLGIFTNVVTGLTPNTLYYVRAYAINSQGTAYGEQKSFTTAQVLSLATVITSDIATITTNSAVLGGNVTSDGNASVTERGIVYSLLQNPTTADTKVSMGSGTGIFSNTVTGLTPNTLYYIRAYAINNQGTAYGDQKSFTTAKVLSLATVITSDASTITSNSVILGGNVTSDGNAAVTERGIVYSQTQNPTTANSKVAMGNGLGIFTNIVTGLTSNTLYYARAYAVNSQGTAYGEQKSFTTSNVLTQATVITSEAISVTNNSAVLGGNVTSDGNAAVTERGIVYSQTQNPTTSDTKVSIGSGLGIFSNTVSGLTANTLYYVRAYAINSQGTAYGEQKSFTSGQILSIATVITSNATIITTGSAVLGGNVTNEGNAAVTEKGIVYSITQNPTTADTKVSMGSGSGIFSNTVTGLTPNTLYYVRAYAINSQGTAYGEQKSFTTAQILSLAIVITSDASTITTSSAVLGGNVTSDGNAAVTERGIVYSQSQNPTTADTKVSMGSGSGIFSNTVTGLTPNTLYYVRAYAINSQGTAYGEQKSFTTAQVLSLATVITSDASTITAISAVLGGNVTSDGNAAVTERGIVYSQTQNPTTANNKFPVGSGTGSFTNTVTGLTPNTLYYVRAYAINSQGTAYGEQKSFSTALVLSLATIITSDASTITTSSAVLGGNVTSDGNAAVTERGIVYSQTQNPTTGDAKVSMGSGTGIFSNTVTGLIPNTLYYVRAYAINSQGTAYGEQKSFTTAQVLSLATVITSDASTITTSSAVLGGNVTSDGNAAVTERGIVYSQTQNPTTANSKVQMGNGLGIFTNIVTGLTPNTIYYVRAYAINSQGTAYGEQKSFTTAQVLSLATVITSDASTITTSSAVLGGNVTSDGNAAVTERGIVYSQTQNPTTADSKITIGNGLGIFTYTVTGLTPNTLYYIRAYAINSQGTAYGEQKSFATAQVLSLATVITSDASTITTSSAVLGGNVTSDGNLAVTERGIVYSQSQNPTTADTKITVGNGLGIFTNTVTGLTPNTLYYVRAYAINSQGTAYGNQVTFTTTPITLPAVTTNSITNITQTTATGGGYVTSDGNSTITARGVCWNATGSPTITDSKTADGTGTGSFISNLTGLTAGTTYYVRAYAINSLGTAYGSQVTFTTNVLITLPTVTTSSITAITQTTATGGGNVTSDGGSPVLVRGVCWGTTATPTIDGSKTIDGAGTDIFVSSLTGLAAGTTYYVRAYATNSIGTAYGSQVTFTTNPVTLPVVTTNLVTNITQTTATSGGNVTSDGGAMVIARGVCWGTTETPTIEGSKTTDGTGVGTFTSSLTGLTAGTTYYVRAYATNSLGTTYGAQVIFSANTFSIPTVTTAAVINITKTTATTGGNITSDGGKDVTSRGVCWGTTASPTIDGSKTNDGTGTGSFTSSLTGLAVGKTYYVRAYAINSQGTGYGEQVTFSTTGGDAGTLTDIDGNVYQTITIGTQVWMAENLKTTRYKDGSAIPYVTDATSWLNLSTGAYCWPSNNSVYKDIYGALYNYFTIINSRGICPAGWHVPSDGEWTILENYLIANGFNYDGTNTGNKIAKSMATTTNWNSSTVIGSVGNTDFPAYQNKSGFSGLPGGYRDSDGIFYYRGSWGVWWSSTKATGQTSWSRDLGRSEISTGRNADDLESGLSVRCVKD